ncbi:hypothetical protein GCM10023189_23260 [Nibrella saemangeumensis]|uniref:Secretion system C-terminal sorting domain-containing protein n=1 Tax=Nibrella saemangeumensis TaxID=1084526 RepID=A0ABP8MSP1_9BACT
MKQTLRIYGCLLGLLLATVSLRAQTDGPNRSRLELGRKTTAPSTPTSSRVIHSRNFPFLKHPAAASLDREVALSKNSAINAYYRSLLIAPTPQKSAANARTAQAESTATAAAPTSEIRPVISEQAAKTDELMFANDHITVSNIYPNPANDIAEIDYQISSGVNEAKLILLNVLGAPVADYVLDRNDRKIRIITRDMTTGVYFYQLSVDGKKVATKKLLVRHH